MDIISQSKIRPKNRRQTYHEGTFEIANHRRIYIFRSPSKLHNCQSTDRTELKKDVIAWYSAKCCLGKPQIRLVSAERIACVAKV